MKVSKRMVSLVLVVILAFGMVYITPFASAAYVYNPQPSYGAAFYSAFRSGVGVLIGADLDSVEYDFTFTVHGLVSDSQLDKAKEDYNSFVGRFVRLWAPVWYAGSALTTAKKAYDTENNIWRLADTATGSWIVDSKGRFPYFESVVAGGGSLKELSPDTNPAPEVNKLDGNKWISEAQINKQLLNINPAYSYDELEAHAETLRLVEKTGRYTYAVMKHGTAGYYGLAKIEEDKAKPVIQWLADKNGYPYFTTKDKYQLAINQTVNNVVQDGNGNAVVIQGQTVTTEKPIIDQSQMEVNIPISNDNSVSVGEYINQKIDNISYNFDDHSYTVNTYETTYNNDNRRYETKYYTFNITYNITNTYVTYIGSNDAYQQKEYEFYYELPDGRSSADLTADEVAGMSFQFADVMNYQRSATDSNLRALYHFDGDLSDAGFFSDKTAFTWQQGASITYMDSSTFNGALYLDETAHKFDITLPSSIRTNEDFTIQFRYYQASEPDTVSNIENSVAVGGTTLFRWDERSLYTASSSTALCSLPIGSWGELALVRHNGTIYLYCNGIKVGSWSNSSNLGRGVTFTFGSTSRAYSMLDEFRVLDFAIAQSGASYTPTSVPYDSNLVLVLPGEEAVVDDYWVYSSPNNLIDRPLFTADGDYSSIPSSAPAGSPFILSDNNKYSCVLDDSGVVITSKLSSDYDSYWPSGSTYYPASFGVFLRQGSSYARGVTNNSQYTFSIVTPNGEIFSHTFIASTSSSLSVTYTEFDWGRLYFGRYSSGYYVSINPAAKRSITVSYVELVQGSSPTVVADHVVSVFDLSTLKPNTAAVQTDIPIHGYTVGGVRPTFPVRGDVWFGVTNRRVSSVQVYTGSAWTSSNARWWTGSRWIPIYAFDIFTLEDCWDIADGGDVITPIESDTAGWNWWKKAWTDFRSWLGGVFGGGVPAEPSPTPSPTPTPSPSPSGPVIDDRPLMLAPGVSIIRENSDTWEASNAASVTVSLERGDLWSSSNTVKNLFVVDLMRGAFSDDLFVSLDVDGLPVNEYPQWDVVSFLLYGNDDNYASVRKASHFSGFSTAVETFGSLVEHNGSSEHNAVTSATFALYKKGNQVRVFARPLGGSWQEGETLTVDFTVNKIGFCGWRYNDRGRTATFSNLRISTASRYDLVTDTDTMLTSFVANTSVVPFFLGGGFEVLPGKEPVGPESAPRPSSGPLVDDDGSEVTVWDFPGKLFDSLWGLLSGLVGVVSGGVGGLFRFIGDGVGGFFGAFSGDEGVFQFFTYGGADIWD